MHPFQTTREAIETPAMARIAELDRERDSWEYVSAEPWAEAYPNRAAELAWLENVVREVIREDKDLDLSWLAAATGNEIEEQLVYLSDYQG